MISTLLVWFFALVYPLITVAVWSIGAFGIGATMTEIRDAAHAKYKTMDYWYSYGGQLTLRVFWRALFTFLTGALWPVGIPLYIGFKRGSFINDAVEKRNENITELNKRVA